MASAGTGRDRVRVMLVLATMFLLRPHAAVAQTASAQSASTQSASVDAKASANAAIHAAIPQHADRSPVDLAIGPDEAWLATANQTADSLSLVRIADGKVLDEKSVGRHPVALVLHPDGKTLLISTAYDGRVTQCKVEQDKLSIERVMKLGFEPHGIAISATGSHAYVALAAAGQVVELDLQSGEVRRRVEVGRWPRYLTLSPDGRKLAVGTSGDLGVAVVDVGTFEVAFRERFYALNIGHMVNSPDGKTIVHPWTLYGNNAITPGLIRLGWVVASRLARVQWDGPARREAVALDQPGTAVADVFGISFTSDQRRLVVSASGTHELLVYDQQHLPWREYGIGDHIDPSLLNNPGRFVRIPVGGRPMGLRASRNASQIYVANYLENSVQVVDLEERKVARSFALGGPAEPSLARRGEAIFLDGKRSLDQWYSCHSCHYDGGTNAVRMDTMNDGSPNTFKTVLPLFHLAETGPWTWHGWQKSLPDSLRHSLTTTMLGPEPTDDDVNALLAYLSQLESPPNPFRAADGEAENAAVVRGRELFQSEKAGCAVCHAGPRYTDQQIHDVGLGSSKDKYQGFNTPSLVGVFRKVRLLHDGRAKSLEEALTGDHNPKQVTGKGELSPDELKDLIEFLKTL